MVRSRSQKIPPLTLTTMYCEEQLPPSLQHKLEIVGPKFGKVMPYTLHRAIQAVNLKYGLCNNLPLSTEQRHRTEEELNTINHEYSEGGIYEYLSVQFNAIVDLLMNINLYPQQLWVPLVLGTEPLKPAFETVIKEEPEAQIKTESVPNPAYLEQVEALTTPPHSPQLPDSPTQTPTVNAFFDPPTDSFSSFINQTPTTPKHSTMQREAKALGIIPTPITIRK